MVKMENPGFGRSGNIQEMAGIGNPGNKSYWNFLTIQGIYEIMVKKVNRNIVIIEYTFFGKVYRFE